MLACVGVVDACEHAGMRGSRSCVGTRWHVASTSSRIIPEQLLLLLSPFGYEHKVAQKSFENPSGYQTAFCIIET